MDGMPWEPIAASSSWGGDTLAGAAEEPRSGQKERNPCNKGLVPRAVPFSADCKKFFIGVALGIHIQKTFHFLFLFLLLSESLWALHSNKNLSSTEWINTGLQKEDYISGSSQLFF